MYICMNFIDFYKGGGVSHMRPRMDFHLVLHGEYLWPINYNAFIYFNRDFRSQESTLSYSNLSMTPVQYFVIFNHRLYQISASLN